MRREKTSTTLAGKITLAIKPIMFWVMCQKRKFSLRKYRGWCQEKCQRTLKIHLSIRERKEQVKTVRITLFRTLKINQSLPWWLTRQRLHLQRRRPRSIPGSETSPGERNGNPFQYYCLEKSMDREALWGTVHGVAKLDTTEWLSLTAIWGAITEEKKLDLKTSEFHVILTCFSPTPGGSDDKASDYNAGDPRSIPGSGRCPGEGNGNPLQYSCLENAKDGGTWWATVHGVTKHQTWLSDFTHFTSPIQSSPATQQPWEISLFSHSSLTVTSEKRMKLGLFQSFLPKNCN